MNVLLTGIGAKGQVGETVAQAFAARGDSLVLVGRRPESAQELASAIRAAGHEASGYGCDLSDPTAVDELVTTVRDRHGPELHALVHMAGGFAASGSVAESAVETWNHQLASNLTAAYFTARAFLGMLRKGRGALVCFASEAALPGADVAGISAYAVAKSGLITLVRAIAAEERGAGVRANAVAPASIRTAANIRSMGSDTPYVEREAVAEVVLFLCSPAAQPISGEVFHLTPSPTEPVSGP